MNEKKHDPVNSPEHYTHGRIECIDAMLDTFGPVAVENFCQLNAFKYLWRADYKGGLEDIKKAIWYLNKIVSIEEAADEPDA